MKKVISMAEATNNSCMQTPKQALESAIEDLGNRGAFKNCHKLLILALDEGDDNDMYIVSYRQSGMKMSQCVALCEIAKHVFLEPMGY